jgi:hypothetical protein
MTSTTRAERVAKMFEEARAAARVNVNRVRAGEERVEMSDG